jgi:hypothetical protein
MVLGRFSFGAFCLVLSFALPHQRPILAFGEAAVLAMLVQWSTKKIAMARRVPIDKQSAIVAE